MASRSGRRVAFALAIVAGILALAGCGDSLNSGDGTGAPSADSGLVSWPLFGRVPERTHYLPHAARDEGTVFAFDERSGKVGWSFPTNNFVYGSPAVAKVPGTPPSVYIGSYDEHFYAINALTGRSGATTSAARCPGPPP